MRKKFRKKRSQADSVSPVVEDNIGMSISNSKSISPAKFGDSSIVLLDMSYYYEKGGNKVPFLCSRLENTSEEATGLLSLCCWIREKPRTNGEWQNEHYAFVGSEELGYLENRCGFPDIDCTFEISDNIWETIDGMNEDGDEWHFVFTVNELHEDGNKYIIHTINGANENEDLYDEEDADVGSDCSDYALPSSQYYTHSDIVALLNNPFGRLWSLLANK